VCPPSRQGDSHAEAVRPGLRPHDDPPAPGSASAQRLYRLDAIDPPGSPARFLGASDCRPGDTITIGSDGFEKASSATVEANGIFHLSATIKPEYVRKGAINITSAECAQEGPLKFKPFFGPKVSLFVPKGFVLPFTGVPVLPSLALGLSFLLAGVLLVRLSSRPSGRGSPTGRR
jgi:hypothetical protein